MLLPIQRFTRNNWAEDPANLCIDDLGIQFTHRYAADRPSSGCASSAVAENILPAGSVIAEVEQ